VFLVLRQAVTAVIFSEYYHTFKARGVKTVSAHLNLLTTRQFIYGNISIQKLIAEENFQDRALTVSVLSPKQHFCLKYIKNPFIK
jgi:hypothetical protein